MAAAARSRTRPLTIASALVALAVTGVAVPNGWVALAARGHNYADLASVPARTVAIVPGARVHRGQPLPMLRARLEAARTLYADGRVRAILVSGNDVPGDPEVSVMRDWLRERGVPAADLWTDEHGARTRDTMLDAVAHHGVTDAIVCTETLSMPRALFLARAAGIDAVGVELPTRLAHSPKWLATEALKNTLAVAETLFRAGPTTAAARPAVATRGDNATAARTATP